VLALLLSLACVAFPDDVVIPTPTEAIGIPGEQLWAVRDGKLFEKRGTRGAWTVFPTPTLTRPIVAVFADEISQFTIVTDDGLMHHFENGVFDSMWGLPSLPVGRAPLALPFSLADMRPGLMAYSMRRDRALYYEDIRGQQFHWGDVGCTSLFVRHPRDDTRILFGDPWIPPDWSREVCGPDRGTVRIASIAASASVLFAISRSGEMWTRFDDYDHNGGTPLFHYAYDPKAPAQTRFGTDPSSSVQVRQLPGHDWRAQPRIPLEGRARVSRRIAIVQKGVGNDSRELRVVGDDANGERGMYVKQLRDNTWRFVSGVALNLVRKGDQLHVDEDDWLDVNAASRVPVRPQRYAGALEGPRALGHISARVDDFSFHCSPFTLTLTIDGVDVPLLVHAVDAWTIFTHENPVDDPFAPKMLKLTMMPPKDDAFVLRHVKERLDELTHGALGEAFAFVGVANQRELVIQPLGYPVTAQRSRWRMVLRSPEVTMARRVVPIRPASALAASQADACKALDAVREQRRDIERRLALFSSLEVGLPASLGVADAATIVTTTRYTLEVMRWLTALELHVPAVAAAPSLAYARWLEGSQADFDEVEASLDAKCRSTK
jgi:hypothetical protein